MASNTKILIKRSETSNTPGILNSGELAYSYASNTLFIGTPGSDGYVEIGHYSNLTNLTAGVYGDATHIPIITVDSHGTVTNVTTSAISTTLGLASDSGSNTMSLLDGTLTISGGEGITTSIDANTSTVNIDVDNTVLRSNTESVGLQHISTDLEISGNLTVQGTTTYVQTAVNQTDDSLLELAANNTVGDVLDIGFYGKHQGGEGTVVTGLVRNAGTSNFYLFDNIAIGDQANLTSNLITQSSMANNGATLIGKGFLAAESSDTSGGYGFTVDGGQDTGMYSSGDGQIQFKSNNNNNFEIGSGSFTHHTDITLSGNGRINNPTESSGDGLNASTIELVPDNTLETDQYIVIDPTSPNHIHLRAGGTIDGSSADLFLGAEQNHIRVSDGSDNVVIKTNSDYNWTFATDGTLELPNGANLGDHSNESVFFGQGAGQINQGQQAVAIGNNAGNSNQGTKSVAIGQGAGNTDQGGWSVAIGLNTATLGQGTSAVAVGHRAGSNYQGSQSVAIGVNSAQNNQGQGATAVGYRAAYGIDSPQGNYALALGAFAGQYSQAAYSIALNASGNALNPTEAGLYIDPIRLDNTVGGNVATYNTETKEVVYTDVVVNNSGITLANGTTISDADSGFFVDSLAADATPTDVVFYNQTTKELTYGSLGDLNPDSINAGSYSWTVDPTTGALYSDAGVYIGDNSNSVVIGQNVDLTNTNNYRVAIGQGAGNGNSTAQGAYAVAIGAGAGYSFQSDYSIILNASSDELNAATSGFFVNPVAYTVTQDATDDGIVFYNQVTKEIRYSYSLDGGSF